MLRAILAIGVLLAIGLPVNGKQESGKPSENQQAGNAAPQPPPPPSTVVACKVKEDGTSIECRSSKADSPNYLSRLFAAENLPNDLLVIAGFGGIAVAFCTLRYLRKQSRLMLRQTATLRRSVHIQAATLRQWVDVTDWEIDEDGFARVPNNAITGLGDTSSWLTSLCFKIRNETGSPLTIHQVRVSIRAITAKQATIEEYAVSNPMTVFPHKPHNVAVIMRFTVEEMAKFRDNPLGEVDVRISYEDVLEDRRDQWFSAIFFRDADTGKVVFSLKNTLFARNKKAETLQSETNGQNPN